jgi:hypothetical protein
MMQHMQRLEKVSNRDVMRYRREAERVIGVEDPLYRLEWVRQRSNDNQLNTANDDVTELQTETDAGSTCMGERSECGRGG